MGPMIRQPGANITGITTLNSLIGTKWLGLFHDFLPRATRFAVLINPNNPDGKSIAENIRPAASAKWSAPLRPDRLRSVI